MENSEKQSQDSVESFEWQWTQKSVTNSLKQFHRRLFLDPGITTDHHDGKIVAYFGSGGGRHPWAIHQLSNPSKIISVELAEKSIEYQKTYLSDPIFEVVQGDMSKVDVKADFIYLVGVIQHTESIKDTFANALKCLNPDGEIIVSFYMWTPATIAIEPIRQIMKRLPKKLAWAFAHVLAPIFMVRKQGREGGYKNAVHTAYDWNGSHQYQHYMTKGRIQTLFDECGVSDVEIVDLKFKGLYRIKKYSEERLARISDGISSFGKESAQVA